MLFFRSIFSQWLTICTRENEYFDEEGQCDGVTEDPIIRNPGVFDPAKISGLPTSVEVTNIFQLGIFYDTRPYDKTSNLSFRNLLEGFASPFTGAYGNLSHIYNVSP